MLRLVALAAIFAIGTSSVAQAKTKKATEPAPAADDGTPNPANAPKWFSHAVDDILSGSGPLDDDGPAKGKK